MNYTEKDHKILHYLFNNPKEATTYHTLVQNDMYGADHTMIYDQNNLTKEQIKEMHDNLVGKDNLKNHSTPLYLNQSKRKRKQIKSQDELDPRWETVVIEDPDHDRKLTKKDIFRYYSQPSVRDKIVSQIKDKPIVVRQAMTPQKNWIKREPVIKHDAKKPEDKEDYQYHIERRNIEFHPTFSRKTEKVVVDIDPGKDVNFEDTKKVANYISKFLKRQNYITDTKIQFSGHRGFYVFGYLDKKMDINDVRQKLERILSNLDTIKDVPVTTKQITEESQIRLDLSPNKELGSVKAEGSLDYRTGLISKDVPESQLKSFKPERDAAFDPKQLRSAYSYRDETIV